MQRNLTSSEIDNYTINAKKLYLEKKIPEELCDKLIKADIETISTLRDWTHKLEETQSLSTLIEASTYYSNRRGQIPGIFKELGFSDEQYNQIHSISDKIKAIEPLNNTIDAFTKISEKINENFKKNPQLDDPSQLKHLTKFVANSLENKSDLTSEESATLDKVKELDGYFQDEGFLEYLSMTEEQRQQWKLEQQRQSLESISSLRPALQRLSFLINKFSPSNDDENSKVFASQSYRK